MSEVTFARQYLKELDNLPVRFPLDYAADPRTLEIDGPYTLPKIPEPKRSQVPDESNVKASSQRPSAALDSVQRIPDRAKSATTNLISITLKSLKNPPLNLRLTDIDPSLMTIYEMKEKVVRELTSTDPNCNASIDKIKILWERRPVADTKTIKDAVGSENLEKLGNVDSSEKMHNAQPGTADITFTVMVLAYKTLSASTAAKADVATTSPNDTAMTIDPVVTPQDQKSTADEAQAEMKRPAFWTDLQGFLQQRLKDENVAQQAVTCLQGAWRDR